MAAVNKSIPPSMAWLTVFLPALTYYVTQHLNVSRLWGRSSSLGVVTTTEMHGHCHLLKNVFYFANCPESVASTDIELRHPLYLVQEDGLQDVVSTVWRHNSELGRGYLLLSESKGTGRIWRWEVGGGPIPIGKTLHISPSGCRSNNHLSCDSLLEVGSAGLAVDFLGKEHAAEGKLVVSELGEGRIVRMEENGARTPIIVQAPNLCSDNSSISRLESMKTLLYTPFGDLLVVENQKSCGGAILRVRNAMHIEPLESAAESRKAHFWDSCENHNELVEILYKDGSELVGGVALDEKWTGLYATVLRNQSVVLLHFSLKHEDEEEEGESLVKNEHPRVVVDLSTHYGSSSYRPGAVAVDHAGHIFVSIDAGIAVLDSTGQLIGTLSTPQSPTSLTLGEDGFLYVSTANRLLRIKIKTKPVKVPTDLVSKRTRRSQKQKQ